MPIDPFFLLLMKDPELSLSKSSFLEMQRLSISRKQNLIICNETYFNKQQISILLSVISLCLISLVIYLSTHLYFQ